MGKVKEYINSARVYSLHSSTLAETPIDGSKLKGAEKGETAAGFNREIMEKVTEFFGSLPSKDDRPFGTLKKMADAFAKHVEDAEREKKMRGTPAQQLYDQLESDLNEEDGSWPGGYEKNGTPKEHKGDAPSPRSDPGDLDDGKSDESMVA